MIFTEDEREKLRKEILNEIKNTKTPLSAQSSKPYIIVSLVMTIVVILAISLLQVFSPEGKDSAGTIAIIVGLSATFTGTMFTLLKNQETHIMINNRLSEWMESNSRAERAEGNREGRDSANARTDLLASQTLSAPIEVLPLEITIKEPEVK